MSMSSSMFPRLPIARKLLAIVAMFVAIVVCVFYLGIIRSDIPAGVRAYVGGEGLWSNAEKGAVISLSKYAASHDERDYQDYLREIAIPAGDREARLQLQAAKPDYARVYRGFVQGRNNPEDVESMTRLFRRFEHYGFMARAIAIWTEGDGEIDQLRALAEEMHAEVNSSDPDQAKIHRIADQVLEIDGRLTPLEDAFSSTLAEGGRWIHRVVSMVILIASAILLLIGIALSTALLSQLRTSEERYRGLINTAKDAILVIDAERRLILEANTEACHLLGFAEKALIGLPESELYPPGKPLPELLATRNLAFGRGLELELLRADGTAVPVEVRAAATELGGKPAILGIFRDIRERVEAAAELRRSEERFGYLIQNLSDVITVVAVDGTMLHHSPSVTRVTGYQPWELLGNNFLAYVHPDDEPSVRAALERVILRPGSATPPEFRFRHKDGSWIWLESVANNLLNDAAVGGIVVTSRNVTARRVLEEQVRQSQKMEAVGRLAGGIAHDFNNMLMVIQGYAEIVLQEDNASPSVTKSVETILRTADSAANLTRQLLSFSRKHAFHPQVLDLNSLVNRMSEMLLGLLREEMEFVVRLNPETCCINADPGQIEQVIMNLVVNARDAMPKGGKLTLETARVSRHGDGALRGAKDQYVMLAVSDTGIGMDAETQSRIFEPFFTTKGKDEGTGLGLAVVYNIVRGSGGYVRVQSELGKGTTMQVFFPRVAAPAAEKPAQMPVAPLRSGLETILVAEDQPDLRWMICQFLQGLGYSVLEAKDGGDAVALAEQYKGNIDIVLTDVVMPHLRGSEVVRRLASARPEIKIMFMSGYTEGELSGKHMEDYGPETTLLQKPFELDRLAAKIREVLEARTRR